MNLFSGLPFIGRAGDFPERQIIKREKNPSIASKTGEGGRDPAVRDARNGSGNELARQSFRTLMGFPGPCVGTFANEIPPQHDPASRLTPLRVPRVCT